MQGLHAIRSRIVDGPESLAQRRRALRWAWVGEAFPEINSMSVLDLGGTAESWLRASLRPESVHIVNLESPASKPTVSWIREDRADACELPAHIRDGRYDLVFSNSVIEHVGGHSQRMRFAEVVHKLADRHWVQTPYRYFPIEPHWLFPGFQFLPLNIQAELAQRWPLVHTRSCSWDDGLSAAMGVELLSRAAMTFYFPNSALRTERMMGMVKSLISVKTA